jgi:hypothetical protein
MKRRGRESGNTLISVLVALGVLGFILAMLSNVAVVNTKLLADVDRRADYEDARRWLGAYINCPATRAAMGGACPAPGAEVALLSAKEVLVPKGPGYRVVGKYELRARCAPGSPMTIDVQIHKVGATGGFESLFDLTKIPIQC